MPGTYQYDVEIKSNVEKLLSDMKQVQDRLDTVEGKEYKIKLNVDEKKLSSVISNLEKMLDSLGKGTGDFKQFENLSKELSSVVSEVQSLSKAFGKVDDSGTKTLLSSIQSIDKSLSELSQNILNVNKNMSNMGGNTSGVVKQVENISNAYQNAAKEAEKLADAQSKIGQKTNISSGNKIKDTTSSIQKQNDALKELILSWVEAQKLMTKSGSQQIEKLAVGNINTGYASNANVTGDLNEISSKLINNVINAAEEKINTMIHSHPDSNVAAFSPEDIQCAIINYVKGLENQIVVGMNEVSVMDVSKLKDINPIGIIQKIQAEIDNLIDSYAKNKLQTINGFQNALSNKFGYDANTWGDLTDLLSERSNSDLLSNIIQKYKSEIVESLTYFASDKTFNTSNELCDLIYEGVIKKYINKYIKEVNPDINQSDFDALHQKMSESFKTTFSDMYEKILSIDDYKGLIKGDDFQSVVKEAFSNFLKTTGIKYEDVIKTISLDKLQSPDFKMKDAFPNADTKLDEAVTSAKDLDKTLEQVDIPTDRFDKVLEKLDRTKSELVDIVKITKQSVSDADGKFHDSYTLKDSRGSTEIYGVNSKTDKGQILRQNIVGYDKKKDELDISKAQLEVDKQLAKEEDNLAKAQQKKAQAFLKEQANYEEDQKKAELIKRQTLAYEELTDTISKYSEVAKRIAGGNAEDGDLELMTKLEDKISQLQKQPILSDSQVSKSEKSLVSLYDQLDKIERKLVETNQKSQDKQIAGFDKRLESYTKKTSGYNATIARFNDGGWTSDAYLKNVQAVKDAVKQYEDLLSDIKAKGGIASEDDIQKLKEYESEIKDTIATVTNMSAAEKGYNFVSGQKELDKIHKLLNENSKMSSEAKAKIKAYYAEIESGNPSMSLDKIHGEILKIYNAEVEAGRAGRTLWDTMKHSGFHQIAAQMAGMFGVYDIINIFKQGANTLKEFDDGLTKISYTMDMTKSQLDGLGKSVLETANDIDSSIDNAMKVSQIYANMNTSAEEIKKLSEPTLILSNLTGFDASTVADDIQAVTQQFEISAEESMHIADVYDQISRNISVDYSKGIESIAEAVQVAGSTSKQAGKLKDLNVQKCA